MVVQGIDLYIQDGHLGKIVQLNDEPLPPGAEMVCTMSRSGTKVFHGKFRPETVIEGSSLAEHLAGVIDLVQDPEGYGDSEFGNASREDSVEEE